jgi:peptidyl-prolyl cis-trans isomerase D
MSRRSSTPQVTKKHLARAERERIQRNWIVFGTIFTAVLLIGILVYGWVDLKYLQPLKPVAVVGGQEISIRQFQGRMRLVQADLLSQYQQYVQLSQLLGGNTDTLASLQQQLDQIDQQLSNPTVLGQSVLDSMVQDILIRKEADARGITVVPAEIDKAIEAGFGYYPEGTPTPAPTATIDPTLLAAPTSTPTEGPSPTPTATATPGSSPTPTLSPTPQPTPTVFTQQAYETEVKDYFVNLETTMGATEADLRSRIEASLYRQKLQTAIGDEVPAQQEEVRAKHILVADEQTANEVMAKIKAGEDWNALASEYSIDTSNKDNGGELGWFPRGQMVSEFETAAFDAPVGALVGPVQTSFGWHIIKIEGHEVRTVDPTTLAAQRQKAFNDWLTNQRAQTDIVITPGWEQYAPAVEGFPTPTPGP